MTFLMLSKVLTGNARETRSTGYIRSFSKLLIILSLFQFGLDLGPIGFGLRQPVLRVSFQVRGKILAVAKIKFTVDDPPCIRIDVDGDPIKCNFTGAVAAELGGIFDRLALEKLAMLAAGKVPWRSQPVIAELLAALCRPAFG